MQYRAAHANIERQRGKAAEHPCADCGQPAEQWAYDGSDPAALLSSLGYAYSLDAERYRPLCRPCHAAFDHPLADCAVDGCERKVRARGWCFTHYMRWKRNGDPEVVRRRREMQPARQCVADGCERQAMASDRCPTHYRQLRHAAQ